MKMKSQRGAATLYVLIAMLFFTTVAIGVFITSANKQQMQLEAIRATQKLYDTGETASQAYLKYMGGEVIPISNASQLLQIGSGNTVYVEGKTYVFDTDKLYVLKDDITIQEEDKEKFIQLQQKLANGTVVIESQGYTISLIVGEVAKVYSGNDNFQKEQDVDSGAENYLVFLDHCDENNDNYSKLSDSGTFSTSIKKFGTASRYYDFTETNYESSSNYMFDGDFTIDFWLYLDSSNANKQWAPIIVSLVNNGIWIGTHNNKFVVRAAYNTDYISENLPPMNTWVHIAICRKNSVLYLFYDGILKQSVENSAIFPQNVLHIGTDGGGSYIEKTYIDEIRILKGYGQWTSNFEIPIRAYDY